MKKKLILNFIQEINAPCQTTEIAIRFDMSAYQARHYLMGNDSNLLIVFYVQIMPDDFVMQLHRF